MTINRRLETRDFLCSVLTFVICVKVYNARYDILLNIINSTRRRAQTDDRDKNYLLTDRAHIYKVDGFANRPPAHDDILCHCVCAVGAEHWPPKCDPRKK